MTYFRIYSEFAMISLTLRFFNNNLNIEWKTSTGKGQLLSQENNKVKKLNITKNERQCAECTSRSVELKESKFFRETIVLEFY